MQIDFIQDLWYNLNLKVREAIKIIESDNLPGCVVAGKTQEEVENQMHEAIHIHLEGFKVAKKGKKTKYGKVFYYS